MKIAIANFNDIVPNLKEHFEVSYIKDYDSVEEAKKDGVSAVIIWNDILTEFKILCKAFQEVNIPVIVLQHGRFAASDYALVGHKPYGDYFLVWGKFDYELAVNGGWSRDKVRIVGCPLFESKIERNFMRDKKNVLFAPMHANGRYSKWDEDEAHLIYDTLRSIKGIDITVKLLAEDHEDSYYNDSNIVYSDRDTEEHINIVYQTLSKADCLVTQYDGTLELLAYSIDLPVVKTRNRYLTFSDATNEVSILDLKPAIEYSLDNPEYLHDERKLAVKRDGDSHSAKPSLNIAEFIKDLFREEVA